MTINYLKIIFLTGLFFITGATAFSEGLTRQGEIEVLTEERGRVVLNGVWKFQPAIDETSSKPSADWGEIRVPGSWLREGTWDQPLLPTVLSEGKSGIWKKWNEDLKAGWYQRSFTLPESWAGRRIQLDFHRISTDAKIWVNDKEVGEVRYPFGVVDITDAAKAGENILRVLVVAAADEGEQINFMGYANESKSKAKLVSAGIIGEVLLDSMPKGGMITDVFVKPSVRKKELTLEVEFKDVSVTGEVSISLNAMLINGKDAPFNSVKKVAVSAKTLQTVEITVPWADPKLWDLNQPNLYNLTVSVNGLGLKDSYLQRFGFREFWIEGRQFYLNGTTFNLRPTLAPKVTGDFVSMEGAIKGMREAGYNISQIWPNSVDSRRGNVHFWDLFYKTASEKGWPMIGAFTHVGDFMMGANYQPTWESRKEDFKKLSTVAMRKVRNEPAILLWGTTGNFFNHDGDQDPRNIGMKNYREPVHRHRLHKEWLEALAWTRMIDPTRPLYTHAGNTYGDVFTTNHYLNFIPLQEREEWLSEWSEKGDMPFLAAEFGTPLDCNIFRGRNGFGGSITSEPLLTEYMAGFFGIAAYKNESEEYRKLIVDNYEGDKQWKGMHTVPAIVHSKSWQELQTLFIRNTWRSWRTAGVSGGMIPWSAEGMLWSQESVAVEKVPEGKVGRGVYYPVRDAGSTNHLQGPYHKPLSGGKALMENNGPTLAWIAGGENFYDKNHSYFSGEVLKKQAIVLNDLRVPAAYTLSWKIEVDQKVVAEGKDAGNLLVGSQKRVSFEGKLPNVAVGKKIEGKITLNAKIGSNEHTDVFNFRIFEAVDKVKDSWLIFDPAGDTTAFLKEQGIETKAWDGKLSKDQVLAIGRQALSKGAALPGSLEKFVREGGRVIVFNQDAEWFRSIGFRVHHFLSRQVFAVDHAHPVVAGLDEKDLRDWRGSGSLVEPKPIYSKDAKPSFGWRWGSRHSVSSGAIEKPHHSGWRPILECEFDLAYSPLMEMDLGLGRIFLCNLEFEKRGERDPALEKLFAQFAKYVKTSPSIPRDASTIYIGDAAGESLVKSWGVRYKKMDSLSEKARLIILGQGANVLMKDVEALVAKGQNVFILPVAKNTKEYLGQEIDFQLNVKGLAEIPTGLVGTGLSLSDLRFRTNLLFPVLKEESIKTGQGLLLVQTFGTGTLVRSQLSPAALESSTEQYLRTTYWRLTRANTQILANLGAEFLADSILFDAKIQRISIAGEWSAKLTKQLPATDGKTPNLDKGVSSEARSIIESSSIPVGMMKVNLPGNWKPELDESDGEAVFTKRVKLPANWIGKRLEFSIGRVDNFDQVFIDGNKIGGTEQKPNYNPWNESRFYRATVDQAQNNEINLSIRVFDSDSNGGVHGRPEELYIQTQESIDSDLPGLYVKGFSEDFELGDDPARYYRW